MPPVRKLFLIVPAAAIVILSLVMWRLWLDERTSSVSARGQRPVPAPLLQLPDQQSELVRSSRYRGRRKIVVVFFDGEQGAAACRQLIELRDRYGDVEAAGAAVIAISAATPYANRQQIERSGAFPFPLLSDVDYRVHRQWGLRTERAAAPQTGLFLVDRGGLIRFQQTGPETFLRADDVLKELAAMP